MNMLTVCFMLLQQLFEYPDTLRQPSVNPIGYLGWAIGLIAVGVTLLVRRAVPALDKNGAPLLAQAATL